MLGVSCQVALSRAQAVVKFGLKWGPYKDATGLDCLVAGFRLNQSPRASSENDTPRALSEKGKLNRHQRLLM